jgi:hypothetical protein
MLGPLPTDTDWLETWSWPADLTSRVALGLAAVLLVAAAVPNGVRRLAAAAGDPSLVDLRRRRRFLALAGTIAAFLSLGYVALYLQGGPRAPDAAIVWLQGRALSHGRLAWSVPEPMASFHTRGLLSPSIGKESGSFPPGFPLLLAFGFAMGAPMVVGPLLAGAILVATWWLARELAAAAGETATRVEGVGRTAAGLSIACAALRYHTAETLPFGAAALGVTVTLAAAFRACRTRDGRFLAVAGAALGALVAVEPRSAIAVGAVALAMTLTSGAAMRRAVAGGLAAAIPGTAFLFLAGHAQDGRWFAVMSNARAAAFPAVGAGGGTEAAVPFAEHALDLLRAHFLDVANFEPLALVALIGVVGPRRSRWASWGAVVVAIQFVVAAVGRVAEIAPGAGASWLAPVLSVEHALVAFALARAFPAALERAAVATIGFAVLGFATHASLGHQRMAAADGGRPHYEPDVPREAGVESGLLFFDDDVGYELARDPGVPASHGVEAIRLRSDDHDRLAYDILGHPPSHRYLTPAGRSSVIGWSPAGEGSDSWRFETESDWPPTSVMGGTAEPSDERGTCASGGHAFRLTPAPVRGGGGDATAVVELPVPHSSSPPTTRTWVVTPRVVERGLGAQGTIALVTRLGDERDQRDEPIARWAWTDAAHGPSCVDLTPTTVELGGDRVRAWLVVTAHGGAVAVDRTVLRAR